MPELGQATALLLGNSDMVERDNGTLRTVAWSHLFPWVSIFRAFRPAITIRCLVFGALGILLTTVGWGGIGSIFATDTPSTAWMQRYVACPWRAVTDDWVPNRPELPGDVDTPRGPEASVNPPWAVLTRPALEGLARTGLTDVPIRAVVGILLCGLWGIAVWAFLGAAICRTVAVKLAADEQVGWGAAIRFALRKWPSYFAAPLFPLAGVLLAAIPVMVLGLIMRSDTGLLLGGLLWPLVLAAGFIMMLFLLGLLFGWPLMWGAISTEGTDSFDALSRSYAYVYQRPLHYLFYTIVATAFGWLGWLLVKNFAAGIVWLGYWAAGWTAGSDQVASLLGSGEPLRGVGKLGAWLVHFWAGCVKLLAVGYLFSYFWAASEVVYLLLRRNVDATEMDEVFLDADASEPASPLPTIATDSQGAPVVDGPVATSASDQVAEEKQ